MMPLDLPPQCFLLDPPTPLHLGIDYEWDGETNAIRRLPDGAIPPGGTVIVQQQTQVASGMLARLAAGEVVPLAMPTMRVQADTDWQSSGGATEWSDLVWQVAGEQALDSSSAIARLTGPQSLADAWNTVAESDPVVRIAAVLTDTLVLALFEGFATSHDSQADAAGRVTVTLALQDPLLRLEPPYARLETRRWGRTLRLERTTRGSVQVAGFTIRDVIETRIEQVLPTAHEICRAIFATLDDPWFTDLSLGFLDFPIAEFDGRGQSPLELLRTIARLAGARVEAVGRLLVIHEVGPSSRSGALTCRYPVAAIHAWDAGTRPNDRITAVQLFGHTENGLVATRPQFPYVPNPAQPGYARLGETHGRMEPSEPIRTDEVPAPLLITFTFNATFFDPSTLVVEGAQRIGPPSIQVIGNTRGAMIELEIPWVITDVTGEAPFTLDENGNPRFVLAGQIIDALASSDSESQPIPYAKVTRIRLSGDLPTGDRETILADQQGYYRFTDVELARWRIEAEALGYRMNWEDSDPDNNLIRDLEQEYADWLAEHDNGRYRKESTPYHITIWGRAYPANLGIQDLTLGQVRVEVRAAGVATDALHYAPAIREEQLTTERLAMRVGHVLLWAAAESQEGASMVAPFAPLILPGDRLVVVDGDTASAMRCGTHRWRVDARTGEATSRYRALTLGQARALTPAVADDPLGTRVGTVVAIRRNVAGQAIADVEVEGQVLSGLGTSPMVGEVRVGETVQVAKWFPGASTLLIVARSPMVFGDWRIATVEVG